MYFSIQKVINDFAPNESGSRIHPQRCQLYVLPNISQTENPSVVDAMSFLLHFLVM